MINPSLKDSSLFFVDNYHTIADFSLINQNGDTITDKTVEGKIYVADFFFTTCPDICPIMTKNMGMIQEKVKDDPDVILLSHSVTPSIDSVARLRQHANDKGLIDGKWHMLTGRKNTFMIWLVSPTWWLKQKEMEDHLT